MFWNRARRVRETLLVATQADSTVYSLVAFEDGGLGIARDGMPIESFYWSGGDMDDCMETFMRLARLEPAFPRFLTNPN